MDLRKFTGDSPGKLIPIGRGECAFVPDPLPANFQFQTSLWPLLADAKAKIQLLEGIGRTLPNPGLLLRPLEDREALQSSRLEGTYITARDFLLFDLSNEDENRGSAGNDWREVNNYRRALHYGLSSELPFCVRLIREMHRILTTGIGRSDVSPGEIRKLQVAIGANNRFVPPPREHLDECLAVFEAYLHESTSPDPLIHCFLCHYQFETIHPFSDGNGRVGRLLLALMMHRLCGLSKPWLYLSDVLERRRDEYCQKLFDVSAEGNWTNWIEFCLNVTIRQVDATVERCTRLQELRQEMTQRVNCSGGSVRLNKIVDGLFDSPFVRVTKVRDTQGVTYPTAKADCERLVDIGILSMLPSLSPTTYYSKEIFQVAFEDLESEI
ncbi:MAG: Fic family protein [Planctomycetaceae bacterium]|nr:Fic family protein [Planctomycetaceae bacterium]